MTVLQMFLMHGLARQSGQTIIDQSDTKMTDVSDLCPAYVISELSLFSRLSSSVYRPRPNSSVCTACWNFDRIRSV